MKARYFSLLMIIFALLFTVACADDAGQKKQNKDGVAVVNSADDLDSEELIDVDYEVTDLDDNKSESSGMMILIVIAFVILGPGLIFFFYYFIPIKLWYEAHLSGVKAPWGHLIKMRFQYVPQDLILRTMIKAKNAGLTLDAQELSEHYLAEVDIETVVNTLIRAANANLQIELKELAAQYLAKVDVSKVIHALITARNANLDVDLTTLASQYLAEVDVEKVVDALITAHNSGYEEMTINELKEHYLANGNVTQTVDAFVAARKANLPNFTFKDIAAIDLAGFDVVKSVAAAITPRVVETEGVSGIARDGVQLTMKLKITLRAYIKNIIGGASEETVLARVNESLATEIGQSPSHNYILESPYELADSVEQKNLGSGTAFEIISIDVSDVQVGRDIGAELTTERAKAHAEMARAEMIKAEEKVQEAMAVAFREGKLGVHDYHLMMNTEADTRMRDSIGSSAIHKTNPNIAPKETTEDTEHDEEKH